MDGKITVIMPAYNAGEFIEGSVKSVLRQSYENFELIVVNDGSKDNTAELVEKIAAGDSRVRLITVENGGPAMARNRGLDAMGTDTDYVMFLDADDEMTEDAMSYALSAAEKGAEFVMMGFTIINPDGSRRDYNEHEEYLDESSLGDALPRLYMANMLNQVWAKLISAKLIRDGHLRFHDYRWGEDRLFIFDVLERAEKSAVLPECKYHYEMHPGESLITSFYDKKPEACCLADRRMAELCRRFGTKDDSGCRYMFVKSIFSCMTNMYSPSCRLDGEGRRAYVREIIKNPQVQERSRGIYGGFAPKALCGIMHTGLVWLNMLAFRFVAFTGKFAPKLFMALKHKK
ncbi:MAG: glycosyltransferase family 2 protein [Candidatus Limivicinus sp.]